jgi:hypothetical protein
VPTQIIHQTDVGNGECKAKDDEGRRTGSLYTTKGYRCRAAAPMTNAMRLKLVWLDLYCLYGLLAIGCSKVDQRIELSRGRGMRKRPRMQVAWTCQKAFRIGIAAHVQPPPPWTIVPQDGCQTEFAGCGPIVKVSTSGTMSASVPSMIGLSAHTL